MKGFPGVVGAIDGTHISIQKPSVFPSSYLNRKKFHSIVLQAVCDHNMVFTDVYMWPGSVHDARIFQNSEVFRQANSMIPPQGHVLGDGAYPLSRFVMTPYRDNGYLNAAQKVYKRTHASIRVVVERAFGLLKGKWRCLHHLDLPSVERICDTIYATCVLHNFVLAADGSVDAESVPLLDSDAADDVAGQQRDTSGHHKREYICNSLPGV